jgi:hypothetical protein
MKDASRNGQSKVALTQVPSSPTFTLFCEGLLVATNSLIIILGNAQVLTQTP